MTQRHRPAGEPASPSRSHLSASASPTHAHVPVPGAPPEPACHPPSARGRLDRLGSTQPHPGSAAVTPEPGTRRPSRAVLVGVHLLSPPSSGSPSADWSRWVTRGSSRTVVLMCFCGEKPWYCGGDVVPDMFSARKATSAIDGNNNSCIRSTTSSTDRTVSHPRTRYGPIPGNFPGALARQSSPSVHASRKVSQNPFSWTKPVEEGDRGRCTPGAGGDLNKRALGRQPLP